MSFGYTDHGFHTNTYLRKTNRITLFQSDTSSYIKLHSLPLEWFQMSY